MKIIKLLNSEVEYNQIFSENKNAEDIIYIHGFGGNLKRMEQLAENLKEYNFHAITFPFHNIEIDYKDDEVNVFYFAKLINEFIEVKKLTNVIAIGHSMGGGVLALAYKNDPSQFKKLIFVAPVNKTSEKLKDLFITGFYPEKLKDRLNFLDNIYYDSKKFKEDPLYIRESLKYIELLKNNKEFNRTIKKLGASLISHPVSEGIENALKQIKIPTLLVWGESDGIIDRENVKNYFEQNISPNILETNVIKKSGHTPWDENPLDFFERIKNFIKNC